MAVSELRTMRLAAAAPSASARVCRALKPLYLAKAVPNAAATSCWNHARLSRFCAAALQGSDLLRWLPQPAPVRSQSSAALWRRFMEAPTSFNDLRTAKQRC